MVSITCMLMMICLDCLIIMCPAVSTTSFELDSKLMAQPSHDKVELAIEQHMDASIPLMLVSTVPYVLAAIGSMYLSTFCEEREKRTYAAMILMFVAGGGFGILSVISPVHTGGGPTRYFFGILPAVIGILCALPLIVSYGMDRALEDTYRAAVTF